VTEGPVWTGEWHPFAERFPMYSEERLRSLAENLKEVGQLHACTMTADGLGLDGRNRIAACRIAGVEPRWEVAEGNPWTVILGANVQTRDLSLGQRAMATAMELVESGKRKNGRFQRGTVPEAPDNGGSSISGWIKSVTNAGVVLDWRSDLADEVLLGTLALDAAYQEARQERDRQTVRADKLAQLPADLAALVEAGARDLDEALTEARYRGTVYEADKVRDNDGTPPPSFTDRAESGSISWAEAARLSEGWLRDRAEALERDRRRILNIVSGWGTVRSILSNPDSAYVADVLDGLGESDRTAITGIITDLQERSHG
jgi:hypothetical protein